MKLKTTICSAICAITFAKAPKLALIFFKVVFRGSWNMEIDQEPVRWQAKPCGWHRGKGARRQKALSLIFTAAVIFIALDTAALEQIYQSISMTTLNQKAETVSTDNQSITLALEIDLDPKHITDKAN